MKTRIGLVSNSSSSSFILVLSKKPESVEEVFKLMFNGVPGIVKYYDYSMTRIEIAERVFSDLQTQNRITLRKLKQLFINVVYEECLRNQNIMKSDYFENFEFGFPSDSFLFEEYETPETNGLILKYIDNFCRLMNMNIKLHNDELKIKSLKLSKEEKDQKICKLVKRFYNSKLKLKLEQENDEMIDVFASVAATRFYKDHSDWWIVELEYYDDSPNGNVLEHGDIFKFMSHVKICNH